MAGIIKVRKTANYVQVSNDAIQRKLKRADSIGILTYLISLPETWVIQKTDLMKRFGRATTSHAFKELEDTGFLVSMKFREGQRNVWAYAISDIEFTEDQIIEMVVDTGLPCLEVKCQFDIDPTSQFLKSGALEKPVISNVSQLSILSNSSSTIDSEQLNVNNSETTTTKETKEKKMLVNTISSSSSIYQREKIDEALKAEYPNVPFEEVRNELLSDQTAVIKTDRQYRAMLKYRLANYKPKAVKRAKAKNSGRTETVPEWFNSRNEKQVEESEAINFEEERRKILEKLNQK